MKLVLDASVALAWLFARADLDEANTADLALRALADLDPVVPWLWHAEIANALLVAERRGAVTEARTADYLGRLGRLPLSTDDVPVQDRREGVMALARRHGLTAHHAIYLDLALRHGASLATLDRRLAAAMRDAGGKVLGE